MARFDYDALVRALLLDAPKIGTPAARGHTTLLSTLVGQRIYAGVEFPDGYRPVTEAGNSATGPGVRFETSMQPFGKGTASLGVLQIRVWAVAASEGEARSVARAVWGHLYESRTSTLKLIRETSAAAVSREAEPRLWPMVSLVFESIVLV